jgi:hypothetical protein
MSGMHIAEPGDGARLPANTVFPVTVGQRFQVGADGSVATLQFSNHEDGPWVTCEGMGQGGSLECTPVEWDARNTSFLLQAKIHGEGFARVAVFHDQGLTGPEVHVSPPRHWFKNHLTAKSHPVD